MSKLDSLAGFWSSSPHQTTTHLVPESSAYAVWHVWQPGVCMGWPVQLLSQHAACWCKCNAYLSRWALFCLLLVLVRSKLWGCAGELYNMPNSTGSQRLLDWSYAGYMAGEMPIPKLPIVTSVAVSATSIIEYHCRAVLSPPAVLRGIHSDA